MNPPPSQVMEKEASPEIRKGGRRRQRGIETVLKGCTSFKKLEADYRKK